MPIIPAADVQPGDRVWLRLFGRWVTVVTVAPTGRLKFGTDDVPMYRIGLGPDARPAKALEVPADQDVLIQGQGGAS